MCVFKKKIKIGSRITPNAAITDQVGWGLKMMNIPPLWMASKGEGVAVAVLDTGIDKDHPDLRLGILDTKNFTKSPDPDRHGHGTHCAGIVGARANGIGVVGVAPSCGIMAGKVLDDRGNGSSAAIAKAIKWATKAGAHIISMSLGSYEDSADIRGAIEYAFDRGVILIAAAGNDGKKRLDTVNFPAAYPQVISVGAINEYNRPANFSGRGENLDFVAPGTNILSTVPGGYAKKDGTSMATPFVAGLAALILAKHINEDESKTPIKSTDDMREHLKWAAVDKGKVGRDVDYGWGLIDVTKL